jgi:hypothetical protein
MSNPLKVAYRSGTLHAMVLDDNTVALIMPLDYAATARDVFNTCTGNNDDSRRKYTQLMWQALSRLKDMPEPRGDDMRNRANQAPGIHWQTNEAVKT